MSQKDILGREIKVGDIVVATNNSTIYQQIHVVTRLGADKKIQVDGASYCVAEYLMVCTEQYTHQFGIDKAQNLIDQYKEYFNEEKVQKKKPSPKFIVYRVGSYSPYVRVVKPDGSYTQETMPRKNPNRYFCIAVSGTKAEMQKDLREFLNQFDLTAYGEYFDRKTLAMTGNIYLSIAKELKWCYTDMNHAVSAKALKEFNLGLEQYINQEITDADLLVKLEAIRDH